MDTEGMTASPPRLPPFSGVLVTTNPAVVRPVAVYWSQGPEVDDGFSSSGSMFNLYDERMLLALERGPSGYHSAPPMNTRERPASCKDGSENTRTAFHHPATSKICYRSMPQFHYNKGERPHSLSSSGGGSAMLDVLDSGHSSAALLAEESGPSPSDSGVAELEAQLREKDAEIAHLRQTLERNEQAIIEVYEEKEQFWCRRLDDMRELYEQKLQKHEVTAAARDDSPFCSGGRWEEARCRPGNALKLWLATPQLDSEVAELTTLMEDSRLTGNADDDVRQLRLELHRCRRQLQLALQGFEEERQNWQRERAQTAQYQRQLETNYWQMVNHNRTLLRAVSHASLPLEPLDGWYQSESSC